MRFSRAGLAPRLYRAAAFGPHAEQVMADVRNYSSVEPVIQINDVKLS